MPGPEEARKMNKHLLWSNPEVSARSDSRCTLIGQFISHEESALYLASEGYKRPFAPPSTIYLFTSNNQQTEK